MSVCCYLLFADMVSQKAGGEEEEIHTHLYDHEASPAGKQGAGEVNSGSLFILKSNKLNIALLCLT